MQDGELITFVFQKVLKDKIQDADIHSETLGSDHCPVELILNI